MKRERCTRDAHDMHTTCCAPYLSPKDKCKAPHVTRALPHITWPLLAIYMPSNKPCTPSTLSCDMTHLGATWLIDMWHDSCMCDMTYSRVIWRMQVQHDLIMCDVTHWCVTWLIHVRYDVFRCHMTHSFAWHASFMYGSTHSWVTRLIRVW